MQLRVGTAAEKCGLLVRLVPKAPAAAGFWPVPIVITPLTSKIGTHAEQAWEIVLIASPGTLSPVPVNLHTVRSSHEYSSYFEPTVLSNMPLPIWLSCQGCCSLYSFYHRCVLLCRFSAVLFWPI